MAGVFSIGYLEVEEGARALGGFAKRYFALLNLFGWSMLLVPLAADFGTLWVAVELTTIVSALLVAIDRTDAALEASWKYILIASSGLGIALLSIIVLYATGTHVLGGAYMPRFERFLTHAHGLSPDAVRLAFVLSLVGFGTKVGFVPMHTWLPDAHSEAPAPVSALLSGSLLAGAFYAILRFFQVAVAAGERSFAEHALIVFGVISLRGGELLRAAPGQLQAAARVLLDRAHGHHRPGHRVRRAAGRRRGAAARHHPRLARRASRSSAPGRCCAAMTPRRSTASPTPAGRCRGPGRCSSPPRWRSAGFRSRECFAASSRSSSAASRSSQYVGVTLLLVFVNLAFFGIIWHTGRMVLTPAAQPVGERRGARRSASAALDGRRRCSAACSSSSRSACTCPGDLSALLNNAGHRLAVPA